MRLDQMKNIGKNLADSLIDVGIKTPEELVKVGSIEAALRLDACANKLYALEGAILDVRWHNIDKTIRSELYQHYLDEVSLQGNK
jgi:DNA transformation protein